MKLFNVTSQHGHARFIFATNDLHAAEIFTTWEIANKAPAGDFVVEYIPIKSQPRLKALHLREALALDHEGIGRYDEEHGWTIEPVRDEWSAED